MIRQLLAAAIVAAGAVYSQPAAPPPAPASAAAETGTDTVLKAVDDLSWQLKLGDIALVDKVQYTSLPPTVARNPKAPGATNPLIISAYTFIPKNLDRSKKQPLIVLIHGGVHANFTSGSAHIVRELIEQGYTVISTDYRGSTGYGRSFYEPSTTAVARWTMSTPAWSGSWTPTPSSTPNASASWAGATAD